MAIPVMFGIMGVSNIFVPVFFGTGYDKVKILMPLYSILIIFVSMSYILGIQFLISIGKQNVYTFAVSISAVVNLLMNLVLIPQLASVGATVATITAECVGAVSMILYCHKQGLLHSSEMFGNTKQYWFAGVIMFLVVYFTTSRIRIGFMQLILEIVLGIAVYIGILLILRDQLLISNLKSAAVLVKKKMGK